MNSSRVFVLCEQVQDLNSGLAVSFSTDDNCNSTGASIYIYIYIYIYGTIKIKELCHSQNFGVVVIEKGAFRSALTTIGQHTTFIKRGQIQASIVG